MKILPIAFDSMGVRSMATFVKTKDVNIFIDPSAALGPRRYGLPPHEKELNALAESLDRIHFFLEKTDIVIVTHYHYDHHMPEGYECKVLLKDFNNFINKSQKKRANEFIKHIDYEIADGKTFTFGSTKISFSPPLPHGPDGTKLGYVLAVCIEENQKLVFSSDVQGPVSKKAADWIILQNPDVLIMDGPPTYFLGYKFSERDRKKALENFKRILNETKIHTVLLDHHLVRDISFPDHFPVFEEANVLTAAEYLGFPPLFLEAWRKDLWKR